MASAFSKCAPGRRGEPSLHFIRVDVRGASVGPLPPHTPDLCGLQPPCEAVPAHTGSPQSPWPALPGCRAWEPRGGGGGGGSSWLAGQTVPGSAGSPSYSVVGVRAGRADLRAPRSLPLSAGAQPPAVAE